MRPEIRVVSTAAERKAWVRFPYDHYRGHAFYVPQILSDEIAYFDPKKNPAYQVADVRMFTALDQGEIVGRVAGIVNRLEVEKLGRKVGRFGWFETVDDPDVSQALLASVRDWLVEEGCVEMTGPHGFTDLDPSGILVEGHDQIPTIAGSYQYAYYAQMLESFGLEKQVDYLEFRMDISQPVPILERLRGKVEDDRYTIHTPTSRKDLLGRAPEFWEVLEETYAQLYAVVPLTDEQREFYTKKYLGFLDPEFVKLGYGPDGRMIGFFVGIPGLSNAFRRAWGKLLPLGWWHILRDYRKPSTVDLLLAAVRPTEPTDTLTAWGMTQMVDTLRSRGVTCLEANRQLETNTRVNRLWRKFDVIGTRRARIYRMSLSES